MISIVIPLYNKAAQIGATLQSVLDQSFAHFEVVVVDDGSTDESVRMVEVVANPRIRLIRQSNRGVSAARNRGIEESRYDLIAFLDSDDLWKTGCLQTLYDLSLKYSQCNVFACSYEFKDEAGTIIPAIVRRLPFRGTDGILSNYFEVASVSHPPICASAVMVRKNAIQEAGGFPEGVQSGEDLLAWARIAVKSRIAYSTIAGAEYCFDMRAYNRRPKAPDDEDFVGKELVSLYRTNNIQSLRNYITFWYIIRVSLYMRFPQRKRIFAEIFKGLGNDPLSVKLWLFSFFAILPLRARMYFLNR